MEEQSVNQAQIYPSHMQTVVIPNDSALKRAYEVYKPSAATLQLLSEQNRTIYSELFIENNRLGTLKDLSTVVLARSFGPSPFPLVARSPLLLQVHYDALDVDLPLPKCYHITEERYWKRVVLAKHPDKALAIKRDVNWKNVGVSLKFVELVEQCPVEYCTEEEMKELALEVKDFVQELHITRLQSLKEHYYRKFFRTDAEKSSTDESSLEEDNESEVSSVQKEIEASEAMIMKNKSQLRLQTDLAIQRAPLEKERQTLKEAKQKAREGKKAKHEEKEKLEKKPLKKTPYHIFDIKVSDSEDEGENRVVDKRNKNLYMSHIKRYDYPAQDCHHINLNFVQYFTNLETFILEFLGPLQGRHYHKRHQRFSLQDIQNLSFGISRLIRLKTFRLRNSSMDAKKLQTLCLALAVLPCLEILDFSFDQLNDDCAFIFEQLFDTAKSLKSLELESNSLGEQSLQYIGQALKHYKATELLYLGLARNPINDTALHALVTQIVGTKHIQYLNIRGIKFLTERGIYCCLANELLRKHATLLRLDICALTVSLMAADEIVKSLAENKTILEINCTDCGLDLETEIDINILLQRNKYISEHYYMEDPTVTEEEIAKWLNRTRNAVLLKVLAEREDQKKCLQNRSHESETNSNLKAPALRHQESLDIETPIYERSSGIFQFASTR